MKLLLNAVMVFGALVMAFAQNSTDLVRGGVNSALGVQGTWSCVPVTTLRVTFTNTSAPFAVGDCILLDDDIMHKIPINQTLSLAGSRGWSFPDNTYGDFVQDTSCHGYRLQTTHIIARPSGGAKPGITCDEGFKPVFSTAATGDAQCTLKYGTPSHPVWDMTWPACFAACPAGQYQYLGWCIPGCSGKGDDIGLSCTRDSYTPHTYAIWPWDHCAAGYLHMTGVLCVEHCRPGYGAMSEVAIYSCQADCPPDTFPVLTLCAKNQHDRLTEPAQPPWVLVVELIGVLAAVALLAVAAGAVIGAEAAQVAVVAAATDAEAAGEFGVMIEGIPVFTEEQHLRFILQFEHFPI
jgi:hypothetical protein